jgi:hypothetical protein
LFANVDGQLINRSGVNNEHLGFQFSYLESHELVIRFWSPGIDLNAVFKSNNKKLYPFILDNLEVNSTLEISNINPSISTFYLLEMGRKPTDQSDV